jgi:feruloyl esterase
MMGFEVPQRDSPSKQQRLNKYVAPSLAAAAVMFHAAPAAADACSNLTQLSLPNTTITLAQTVAAGANASGTTKAPFGLCRVAATVKPGPNSNVHFEVWIPTDGNWNGKYQQVGNGGFAGSISAGNIANAVSRGYAAAATDDGTSGPPSGASTFIANMDVLFDYGYRAVKATADNSKAIINALMGQPPSRSYFVGCSDGGREALQEAQRFPADFDGIIAGSPVNDQVGEFGSSYLFNAQVTLNGPQTNGVPDAYIPPSKLPLLTNAVLTQCVGKDGGVAGDQFLTDPRVCKFDPSVVQCAAGQDPTTCLTPAQVQAAKQLYAGPHDGSTLLFPGMEPGGESPSGGWQQWITGNAFGSASSQYTLGFGFGCDLMQGVTTCDYLSINVAAQDNAARQMLQPILSSVNPDLSGFKAHGGKLIQYAGWSDAAIPPQNGLNYHRKVVQTMGDTSSFYRVFMVPGMGHCNNGPGATVFGNGTANSPIIDADHDLVKALERWVEQGIAPDRIIATHLPTSTTVQFQRPLCPFPQRGEYVGQGDPNDAANFACVTRPDYFDLHNISIQKAYK